MRLKGLKILVTGGTGFLGSHIVERCLAEKARVSIFSTGKNTKNVKHLLGHPDLRLVAGDLTDAASLEKSVKGMDLVIHFASFTKSQETYLNPLKDFRINVTGTLLLLEAMRKHGVRKIIFASTGKVYGKPKHRLVNEGHAVNPADPYSLGKYACEKYIALYHEMFHLNYIILRIFGIYGPRQAPKPGSLVGVASIFIENMLKRKDLVIYGDGKLKRDFLYIDDFVNICFRLLHAGLWQSTFNIASGTLTTINELAQIIKEKIGSVKCKVRYKGFLKSDVDLCPDVSYLKSKINFSPGVSLAEGIANHIRWFREEEEYGASAV